MFLYQLSVFLHIVSAIIWIGGMLFLALVIVPATRGLPPGQRAMLFSAVGRRFRTVGWWCIAVLLCTGTVNLSYRGVTLDNLFTAQLWSSPFGVTLALKLGIVAIMLGLSVYHDFVLGPRSVRQSQLAASEAQRPGAVPMGVSAGPVAVSPGAVGRPVGTAPDAEAARLRRIASLMGRLEAVLALVVVALAIMLVRGVP